MREAGDWRLENSAYNQRMSALPRHPLSRLHAALYFWRGNVHRHFGNLSGGTTRVSIGGGRFQQSPRAARRLRSSAVQRGVLYWRELANYYRR